MNLNYLKKLTKKRGIYQHTKKEVIEKKMGFSLDDQSRALFFVLKYSKKFNDKKVLDLAKIYLDYIEKAQMKNGFFHNFTNLKGRFLDKKGSEDSFGETIWVLGYAISHPEINKSISKKALRIFQKAKGQIKNLKSLHGRAYTLLGLYYLKDKEGVKKLADSLVLDYQKHSQKNWLWFEDILTYANGLLPYALFMAYDLLKNKNYLLIGKESLNFLDKVCHKDGIPSPIGNRGFFKKGGKKALFDQQPIDPAMIVLAFAALKNKEKAKEWSSWFLGNNLGKKIIYNEKRGSCYDGLLKNKVNLNQGAESTIMALLAHLELM